MRTRWIKLFALLTVFALLAAACGDGDDGEAAKKICEVTDTGGVDDKSFNQTAWAGAERVADELEGWEAKYLESQAETDYETNINSFIDEGCDLVVTVGFLLDAATQAAAAANPDQSFTIVDFAYDPVISNVLGQVFNTDEAAFLAGYLAAGMTESGKVGTFGGINIPTVTIFMDGFWYGVNYYNQQKGTSVEVLGWDPMDPESGLFTGNFESLDDGRSFAQNLLDEGADIVLPVAGPVGLGSAALASELGTDTLKIIGVDADAYDTDPQNQDVYLTSILKKMDVTVFQAAQQVEDGTFAGGVVVGTLENGGVDLAPYHAFEDAVPDELKQEIEDLKAGIIDGSISVGG